MAKKARQRKVEKVELGGEKRELRLDNAALADIHAHTGINLLAPADGAVQELLSPGNFNTVIWALMGGEDADVTARQVGRWIDMDNMEDLANTVFTLINGNQESDSKNAVEGKPATP